MAAVTDNFGLTQQFLTENDVYVNNLGRIDSRYRTFQDEGPKGLMLHSVGCSQPKAAVFVKSWNCPGKEKAVHAFIEPEGGLQTLPWNFRGWHAGGTANNTHIGVEMTEPATIQYTGSSTWVDLDPVATEDFLRKTYARAVTLFADLCKAFHLDPMEDGVILSHKEGHKRGIASNHGDPEHLWRVLGLSMDGFRADVAAAMANATASEIYRVLVGTYPDRNAAQAQARALIGAGFAATVLDKAGNEVPLYRTGIVAVKTGSSLNIRSGPGVQYSRIGKLRKGDKVFILQEQDGWGLLHQGGWVSLEYIMEQEESKWN